MAIQFSDNLTVNFHLLLNIQILVMWIHTYENFSWAVVKLTPILRLVIPQLFVVIAPYLGNKFMV